MKITRSVSTCIFIALAVLSTGIGLFTLRSAFYQRAAAVTISEISLPSVSRVNEIKYNVTRFRLAELDLFLNKDPNTRSAIVGVLEQGQQNIFIYKKTYESLIRNSEERRLFDLFSSQWDHYLEMNAKLVAAIEKNDFEAAQVSVDNSDTLFEEINKTMVTLSDIHFDGAVESSKVAGASYKNAQWLLGGFSILSLVIICISGLYIRRQVKKLNPIASSATQSSETIQQSVDVLVRSAENLASSATQSASSLVETVATMEEMTSLVRLNSEAAKRAAELSIHSHSSVAKGQAQMKTMIENIEEIYNSSKKISDILIVIEDIAFQTNLLALNAAVEAARAGDQGKGFAVVADAVRTLSQNSSRSAKEIKELIKNSALKTEKGMALGKESAKYFSDIVDSVSSVSKLIQEISSAAQEQTTGISQVSTALNQIDKAIQVNVASTENISGLSVNLQDQASSLDLMSADLRKFTNRI